MDIHTALIPQLFGQQFLVFTSFSECPFWDLDIKLEDALMARRQEYELQFNE